MCMLKNQETAMRAPDESKKNCSKAVLSELHVLDEKRYNSYSSTYSLKALIFANAGCWETCFSSRDELVSSFSSLGFLGAPFKPAAGIRTS